jgi:hypothetical protein
MIMNMSMGKDMISVRNMITKTEGIKNKFTHAYAHIRKQSMVAYTWLREYQINFINY